MNLSERIFEFTPFEEKREFIDDMFEKGVIAEAQISDAMFIDFERHYGASLFHAIRRNIMIIQHSLISFDQLVDIDDLIEGN